MTMPERRIEDLDERQDRIVIDVREPDEFASGHVPGARNIPLASVTQHAKELRGVGEVNVICQSGHRSAQATEALRAAGVDAVDVPGGTSAWIEAGRPIER